MGQKEGLGDLNRDFTSFRAMHSRSNQELLPTLKVCTGSTHEWACPQADAGRHGRGGTQGTLPLTAELFLTDSQREEESVGIHW